MVGKESLSNHPSQGHSEPAGMAHRCRSKQGAASSGCLHHAGPCPCATALYFMFTREQSTVDAPCPRKSLTVRKAGSSMMLILLTSDLPVPSPDQHTLPKHPSCATMPDSSCPQQPAYQVHNALHNYKHKHGVLKYYNPHFWDPHKGTPDFGKPPSCEGPRAAWRTAELERLLGKAFQLIVLNP